MSQESLVTGRLKFRVSFVLTMLVLLAVSSGAIAQNLSGRWAVSRKTLDNGEQDKAILELKQSGDQIKGVFRAMGWIKPVTGIVLGSHFKIFGSEPDRHPFLTGEVVGGELNLVLANGETWVAHPVTPADEFPKLPYIEPPALHTVPANGLALTPPMGWNSWNLFEGRIDDQTVRSMADAMVSSGMRDAGYIFVNIDDTWEGVRDAQGNLQPNHKFPNMKALADYVHSKGLKLGIYSSPGPRTCASYPASYGHEEQDAKTFAAWGIDYLKYDWCSAMAIYKDDQLRPVYQKMGDALRASGRPIVFSLCEYGLGDVQKWGADVGGNLWRTTDDIRDEWASMIGNLEEQVLTAPYAGPGHWNDPDMLEIGNGHMNDDEYRTHMSLWALVAAPLLAGNDVRNMSAVTSSILLNREVIAIDQDPLGRQASLVKSGDLERWEKPLADGSVAVGMVNLSSVPVKGVIAARDLSLKGKPSKARDLWAHQDVRFSEGEYSATIPPHGVLMLRVWPQ
jgi:alpha-galactosidase